MINIEMLAQHFIPSHDDSNALFLIHVSLLRTIAIRNAQLMFARSSRVFQSYVRAMAKCDA